MAHYHFNGTCEQSSRNYHGAIARNYECSDRLDARLSCTKHTIPYRYAVSGCMIPLSYDEDGEIETRRGIVVTQGFSRIKEVRAYAQIGQVYASPSMKSGPSRNPLNRPEVSQALKTLAKPNSEKERVAAAQTLDSVIRGELKPRINRKLFRAYVSGKIGILELLRAAGLLGGRV